MDMYSVSLVFVARYALPTLDLKTLGIARRLVSGYRSKTRLPLFFQCFLLAFHSGSGGRSLPFLGLKLSDLPGAFLINNLLNRIRADTSMCVDNMLNAEFIRHRVGVTEATYLGGCSPHIGHGLTLPARTSGGRRSSRSAGCQQSSK